ncbi:MAG: archease [Nitrososphaerales archaeon]|jgi:SHS2 domain-containing protein
MPFRFLPDIALADIAFEAESDSVNGLFESSALAVSDIMVDPETLRCDTTRKVRISSEDLDRLLYDFLTEIVVVKDVDSLLFREIEVEVAADQKSLEATMKGEPIDRDRHLLRNDIKAVTMHMFGVRREGDRWKATVVLDI